MCGSWLLLKVDVVLVGTMDVDAVQPTRYSPFINFFDVSNNFPWQDPCPEQIRLRRADMNDILLFDILLKSGGIEEIYSLYPPVDEARLRELLEAIESSSYDTLKKDCLVYFLLKWHQDGRERHFQQQRSIPPQFAALADAYWHLDTGINVPRAVAILSDLRLNRDNVTKILRAVSLAPDGSALVRRYVQTAKPRLVEPLDIECYAQALADLSTLDVWQYSRTFNETDEMRPRLFQRILEWSVTPRPRPAALKQLLSLPLSKYEENLLNLFVQKPPQSLKFSEVAVLQDLICVRLIQAGRYSEAIKLDRQFTTVTPPKHLKLTKDRSQMVNEVYLSLPVVERSLLDLELDPMVPQKAPLTPKPATPETRRTAAMEPQDLSQSWEEVQVPETLANKSTATPLRDVRVPVSIMSAFGSAFHASTSTQGGAPPLLPVNFGGMANGSGSTPRKSFPLTSSVLSGSKPRSSLSGVGSRMALGSGPAIASPVSGMKFPSASTNSHGHVFVSASQQQNAFYKPPPSTNRTNGVKRAFEDDTNHSPERPDASAHLTDADVEMESEQVDSSFEKPRKSARKSGMTEEFDEDNVLQHSVFAGKDRCEPQPLASTSFMKGDQKQKNPPGSFMESEDDEAAMDEDHEEDTSKRKLVSRNTLRATRSTHQAQLATTTAISSKPPAKKARQIKKKDFSMSIPGSLMDDDDEEEEEEQVAPLRAPSPLPTTTTSKRLVRKSRSSASVEMVDDFESGVQTRRRSSRLVATSSHHSGELPEPQVATSSKPKRALAALPVAGGRGDR
ncbi:nuclear pore complex assembly-domain-containing protein [Gymnopilus junonius]|uniref:Nuclear pore complex assembly-domain-containing protein n=1 Tax=Gymnopilus junonius TaxID=109634 RepID=A0A9P5NSU4_GYMJU|nr:nuclear pore complex assembly-domain-containing protein [Gymnopilus junonius]